MKIAFIHNEKKISTGAHRINDLITKKLKQLKIEVKNFYPKVALMDSPIGIRGFTSILFFYGLLEHKHEILRYSIIHGTTYTPLPFLALSIPVVTHFGSTTLGFLKNTPRADRLEKSTRRLWYSLKDRNVINAVNIQTRKPMRDIAEIEHYAAKKATAVIAASKNVKKELVAVGVPARKIEVIHNAIEDYWFSGPAASQISEIPQIVFLGRLGQDAFTLKLKGLDRLLHLYKHFPDIKKTTICITNNKSVKNWLKKEILNHSVFTNLRKDLIPNILSALRGSILFIPSRYEGFSLSLVEGMSQGLVPVTYPIGVAPEIIRNGRNGFIVKNQTEAIRRVKQLKEETSMRTYMSLQAVRTARQFHSDLMTNRLCNFYRALLRKSRSNFVKK